MGFKLPGMKSIIYSIIKLFKNKIFYSYKLNEDYLKSNIEDEDINNKINIYKEKLATFNDIIIIELKKNNLLSKIIDDKNINEFFELFSEDYYMIFIDKFLKKFRINIIEGVKNKKNEIDFDSIKKMLKFMVQLRNDSNDILKELDKIKQIINSINWIEFYSSDISNILLIFSKLNLFIEDLHDKIYEMINNKKIKYEISTKYKKYTSIIYKPHFLVIESILKVITSNENIYLKLINRFEEFLDLINVIKEFLQMTMKFEIKLDLYSKEILSLKNLLIITDCLISKKIEIPENISKIINLFSLETELLNEDKKNETKLIESFENLYKTLETLIEKDESYIKTMSTFFKNEFIKVTNESFRMKLLEIIMSNNEFIYTSDQLLKFIISIDISPENMFENKNKILQNQNSLYKLINKNCNNEFLEHVVMNILEYQILKFFDNIPKLDYKDENNRQKFELYYQSLEDNKENEALIIHGLSLDIFKQCLSFLDKFLDKKEKKDDKIKNYNLCKLYAISYIKIYLNKLATFIYEKHQFIACIDDIMDIIKEYNENNKFGKVLMIYIWKIYYNLVGKNWDIISKSLFENGIIEEDINSINIVTDSKCDKECNNIIKEIISEEKSPTEDKYKDYPLLKYFTYTKYRTKNDFKKLLESREKYTKEYPLLFKYVLDNKITNVKKLEYLSYFNEFSNYMIEYYSFKISREEAKNKTLNEEKDLIEQIGEKKIKNFFISWRKIKSKAIQYKAHKVMREKELSERSELVYFLNDINEEGYGMYLAAAYQNFINWQNEFLEFIINNGYHKEHLKLYIEDMKKKINVQEANSNQTLLINECFNGSYYEDFLDLIYSFSRRDIFNKDETINYLNYNSFKYDILAIEEELAKLLLPNKCLFDDENNLKFVSYFEDGFNSGKRDVLQQFLNKYKQTDLNENEKQIIIKFFLNNNIGNSNKKIYEIIKLIIFYLLNNNLDEKQKISEIYFSNHLRKDTKFIEFLSDKGKDFTADKIMAIFFLFEHLCYNDLCNDFQKEYKQEISNEINEKIENKFFKNNNVNDAISNKDIAAAVRRFISRYLVGNKKEDNIIPNSLLLPQLKRPDLWEEKIRKLQNLDELISNKLQGLNLTVGQSFKFYEKIKYEDEIEILVVEDDNDDENYIMPKRSNRRRIN